MCRSAAVQRYLGEPQADAEIKESIARVVERFARIGLGRWSIERRGAGRFLGPVRVPFDRPGKPIHGDIEIAASVADIARPAFSA